MFLIFTDNSAIRIISLMFRGNYSPGLVLAVKKIEAASDNRMGQIAELWTPGLKGENET